MASSASSQVGQLLLAPDRETVDEIPSSCTPHLRWSIRTASDKNDRVRCICIRHDAHHRAPGLVGCFGVLALCVLVFFLVSSKHVEIGMVIATTLRALEWASGILRMLSRMICKPLCSDEDVCTACRRAPRARYARWWGLETVFAGVLCCLLVRGKHCATSPGARDFSRSILGWRRRNWCKNAFVSVKLRDKSSGSKEYRLR
jgi:hypothetical protein